MIVWLASYPRSGNTFVRIILNNAFGLLSRTVHKGKVVANRNDLSEIVGHVSTEWSEGLIEDLRRDSEMHFIKTHKHPDETIGEDDRIVSIVRDGRDAVVSYLNHLKARHPGRSSTLRSLVIGEHRDGLWGAHIRQWAERRSEHRLLVRYEDLVGDTANEIRRLGDFLSISPKTLEVPAFADLNSLEPGFFRKGVVGGWRGEELKGTDEKLFWIYNGAAMKRLGYLDAVPESVRPLLDDDDLARALEQKPIAGTLRPD